MNILNDPKWVDMEAVGEFTGHKYFGRFRIKPYLTHAERSDVARLAEMYNRGISSDSSQKGFNLTLAFLKFHIVESDASWWTENGGLDMMDEAPIYALAKSVRDVQNPPKPEEKQESSSKA